MIFKNIFLASYWILCHLKSQRHFELNILMHQLIASTLFLLNPFYKILFFKEDNMRYLSGLVLYLMHIPIQFSSVAQSCPSLWNPMNHSTPGLPVHHQLPESTQTHVHRVGDAVQPSHPLSFPSPPALNLSKPQGLFKWVSSSHQVAKVLELQLQHQTFQWTSRTDLLYDGLVGSPCSPMDSQESSPTPQFKSINFLALSFLHRPTLTSIHDHWKKP